MGCQKLKRDALSKLEVGDTIMYGKIEYIVVPYELGHIDGCRGCLFLHNRFEWQEACFGLNQYEGVEQDFECSRGLIPNVERCIAKYMIRRLENDQ